jgi:hypothetical protein
MNISNWLNPIAIDLDTITEEIVEWYRNIGGKVNSRIESGSWGQIFTKHYLAYGNSKWCFIGPDMVPVRLYFCAEDASVALMFILKFDKHIWKHNMKELLHEENILC